MNKYIENQKAWYKPGRVIFCAYWREYDKVLDFNVSKGGFSFSVTVRHCDKEGNFLNRIGQNDFERKHSTARSKGDLIAKEA